MGSAEELATEVWRLFLSARSARLTGGSENLIRQGVVLKSHYKGFKAPSDSAVESENTEHACGCGEGESCSICETPVDLSSLEDTSTSCRHDSVFDGVADLLIKVKVYEYMSTVSKSYAAIGDSPFKLEATKDAPLPESSVDEAAKVFYAYLEDFLTINKVTVDQIPEAFDLKSLRDVVQKLTDVIREDVNTQSIRNINALGDVLKSKFQSTRLMHNYIRMMEDTAYYPLGILWATKAVLVKKHVIKNGKLKVTWSPQPKVERVHPKDFWATHDWKLNEEGQACFRLQVMSDGDLRRTQRRLHGMPEISANIDYLLDKFPCGNNMPSTSLFSDDLQNQRLGEYDVLICRGRFQKELLAKVGVLIPEDYKLESYVKAEVWFSAHKVIYIDIIPIELFDMGVYTTVFRSSGDSLWGTPLVTFIHPFAKLYEGTIKSLDESVKKSVGAIVSVDVGVIPDVEKYFNYNEDTGAYEIDLEGITMIPFDSSSAMGSPNFKGVPIFVDQLPSSLNKLLPLLDVVFDQLVKITGIPSLITSGIPSSSGIRTDSTFNQAYEAASKPIQSLLRESEGRVLHRVIKYFYTLVWLDSIPEGLVDLEPEIQLSDALTRDRNDTNQIKDELMFLAQFRDRMPPEKMDGLINALARELGLDGALIPNANPLSISNTPQTAGV